MNEEKPRDVGNKSAIVENYSLDDLVDEFKDLDPDLRKQLDRRGLEDSLDLLTRLEEIIEEIRDEFTRIDDAHEADVKRNPAATDSIDLAAATRALAVVRNGLSELLIESHSLNRLFNGLQDLHTGASPAGMFLGLESNSRRPDASNIQSAKGIIAAIIQAKQKVGRLSRQEAAKWTLKNLSVSLRERISVNPVTERTLIEWLDRYGGKSGEENAGRHAFLEHSRIFLEWPDITEDDCRSLTNGLAKELPSLKRTKHRKPLT